MGLMVACAVIFGVQLRMAIAVSHWHRLVHIGIWGSLAIFVVFILVYSPIIWHKLKMGNIYWSFFHLLGSVNFWFYMFLSLALILLPAWIAKVVQWTYFPRDWQILRERKHFKIVDDSRSSPPNGKARVALEMKPID